MSVAWKGSITGNSEGTVIETKVWRVKPITLHLYFSKQYPTVVTSPQFPEPPQHFTASPVSCQQNCSPRLCLWSTVLISSGHNSSNLYLQPTFSSELHHCRLSVPATTWLVCLGSSSLPVTFLKFISISSSDPFSILVQVLLISCFNSSLLIDLLMRPLVSFLCQRQPLPSNFCFSTLIIPLKD